MEEDVRIKYKEEIQKIENYRRAYPFATAIQVCATINISLDILKELISAGIFRVVDGYIKDPLRTSLNNQMMKEAASEIKQRAKEDEMLNKVSGKTRAELENEVSLFRQIDKKMDEKLKESQLVNDLRKMQEARRANGRPVSEGR